MKIQYKSIWTIFVRPDANQSPSLNNLPSVLKRVYNNENFNQLLPIWSNYDPTDIQQSKMWTVAGGALHLGVLEVYLAIEDANEVADYVNYAPVYDIERVQARILKIPTHYTNFDAILEWVKSFNGEYNVPFDIEDLPF